MTIEMEDCEMEMESDRDYKAECEVLKGMWEAEVEHRKTLERAAEGREEMITSQRDVLAAFSDDRRSLDTEMKRSTVVKIKELRQLLCYRDAQLKEATAEDVEKDEAVAKMRKELEVEIVRSCARAKEIKKLRMKLDRANETAELRLKFVRFRDDKANELRAEIRELNCSIIDCREVSRGLHGALIEQKEKTKDLERIMRVIRRSTKVALK